MNFADYPTSTNAYATTLPGNAFTRPSFVSPYYLLDKSKVPPTFPLLQWQDQSARYTEYWRWYTGEALNETKIVNGETFFKFPLAINDMRKIARQHASMVFGENVNTSEPLAPTRITPIPFFSEDPQLRAIASKCEQIVNQVWMQSGGRAMEYEAATLMQFLGGH